MTTAFEKTKEALASAVMLHHPVRNAPTALMNDASDTAIGAVLEQKIKARWRPLVFFSRQLRKPEREYTTFDRELLGIHLALKHFKYFLEGQPFTIFTDHEPIVTAMKKTSEPASNRQARQLAAISEATGDIRHIDGKNNVVADALSRCEEPKESAEPLTIPTDLEEAPGLFGLPERPSIHAVQIGIDYQKLAVDQSQDPDVQAYRTRESNLQLADVPWADGTFTVLCDISMGKPRPVVPDGWKRRVFDLVHALSHPGARITKRMVSAKFVWYGLAKQVNDWARQCLQCQKSKVHMHTRAPLQKFEADSRRFQHVHVDLVGPLPESKGCRYLLTIIDRFARWLEVLPL